MVAKGGLNVPPLLDDEGKREQGQFREFNVAGLLDDGTLVTTRQETLSGLAPENIQAMHVKQESGNMMGKQVLVA